jgi:hypothetical protein
MEAAMAANPKLLKEWEPRVAEFRASGLSARKWCEQNEISEHKLRYWISRLSEWPQPVDWARVDVAASRTFSSSISINIGVASIEVRGGFDPDLLLEVLSVVTEAC